MASFLIPVFGERLLQTSPIPTAILGRDSRTKASSSISVCAVFGLEAKKSTVQAVSCQSATNCSCKLIIITGPGKCTDYVANNAAAFTDAFWEFGGFSVYNAA